MPAWKADLVNLVELSERFSCSPRWHATPAGSKATKKKKKKRVQPAAGREGSDGLGAAFGACQWNGRRCGKWQHSFFALRFWSQFQNTTPCLLLLVVFDLFLRATGPPFQNNCVAFVGSYTYIYVFIDRPSASSRRARRVSRPFSQLVSFTAPAPHCSPRAPCERDLRSKSSKRSQRSKRSLACVDAP